jgi:hypothetical protein
MEVACRLLVAEMILYVAQSDNLKDGIWGYMRALFLCALFFFANCILYSVWSILCACFDP